MMRFERLAPPATPVLSLDCGGIIVEGDSTLSRSLASAVRKTHEWKLDCLLQAREESSPLEI